MHINHFFMNMLMFCLYMQLIKLRSKVIVYKSFFYMERSRVPDILCLYNSRGLRSDSSLVPPIRQTASIFKQPVTVLRTQPAGVVKTDIKHGTQDKPKQVPSAHTRSYFFLAKTNFVLLYVICICKKVPTVFILFLN